MSMLAEPRRRKRYHLNPRGKALYEDDSRFGTKMLEKMGWSKGRGLGANESGSLDFVRVQFKDNSEGLGYAETKRDDQWTAHEESFNGLLKNLNGDADSEPNSNNNNNASDDASENEHRPMGFGFNTEEVNPEKKKIKLKEKISGISLEEKSKSSKARVHYKKFTRGKDLSRYSEKDLANIFGKKAVEDEADDIYQQLNKSKGLEKSEPEEKEVNANFGGVQTVSTGLSVADYFKQKMDAIRNKNKNVTQTTEPEEQPLVNDDESEVPTGEEPPTKKSKKKKKLILNEQDEENLIVKENITKKRQKKEKEESLPETIGNEEPVEETEPKRKKKKKSNVNDDEKVLPTSEDLKPLLERNDENLEENSLIIKKKNKKAKKEVLVEDSEGVDVKKVNSIEAETVPIAQLEEKEVQNPLKKKKKSKKNTTEEEKVLISFDLEPLIERNDENIEENTLIIKKKYAKKEEVVEKSESVDLRSVNSVEGETTIVPITQLEEKQVQNHLKKKKKSKKNKEIVTEEVHDETRRLEESNLLPSVEVTSIKEKKKKNQSKSEKELEEYAVDDVSELLPDQDQEPIDKSSNEDSDTQQQEELLSMEQLLELRDSFNVFEISTFAAEKFRYFNINTFRGSSLSKIHGYSCTENIKLKVIKLKGDEDRIIKMWSNQTIKYSESSDYSFNKRHFQVLRKTNKRKTVRSHLNAIKRRSAFTIV